MPDARPDDEELTLHFYGEHPSAAEIERALAADPGLRRRFERLRAELEALAAVEAPEPRSGLEARIWSRLAPALERPRRRFVLASPALRFALGAAAALALVAGGFLAGRLAGPGAPPVEAYTDPAPLPGPGPLPPLPAETRERLLEASFAAHLGSSERLLAELANSPRDGGDLAAEERRLAAALLESNRLYRVAAERAGQRRIAALLAELEPLLAELSHAGDGDGTLASARQHLESRDLLFKVRVTRSRI
jgi:hypothetical protein